MIIFNKTTPFNKLFWVTLILLHIIMMCGLYCQFGFNYANEGAKYILNATEILNGTHNWHFNYNSFYSTYELYLAGFLFFKTPLYIICIGTYTLSIWSYYRFYNMLQTIVNKSVAKVWVSFMLLSPMLQYWHFNLFSESFFIAFGLLFFSLVFSGGKLQYTLLFFLSIILLFARPNALFIVGAGWSFIIYQKKWFSNRTICVSILLLGLLLVNAVLFLLPLPYKDFTIQLAGGAIYCGFPTLPYPTLPEGKYTLWNVYHYIYNTYGLQTVIELFLKKIASFFIISRPYYSSWHNTINNLHTISYIVCVIPFFKWKTYSKEVNYFIITLTAIVLLNAVMVGVIYNEWSERHTIQVFPFIFVAVAMAFDGIRKKLFRTF